MAIIPDAQKESPAFQTPRSEKQKNMLYLLGLILIVTAVVVYFVFFKTSLPPVAAPSASPEPGGNLKLFESLKSANLESPILKDKRFEKLILFGQFPIVVGDKGREDPFAAF